MNRVTFLKSLLAAVVLRKLPEKLLNEEPRKLFVDKRFGSSYMISRQMIEDDCYGTMSNAVNPDAVFTHEMLQKTIEDFKAAHPIYPGKIFYFKDEIRDYFVVPHRQI